MKKKECIAMLLAGGQGSRLMALTKKIAKPAVSFGGKYRIIDFSLSNCTNSSIDTVGVLTQYRPMLLNKYIGMGEAWDLDVSDGGVHILPPYATETGGVWYKGTADAIYCNIDFIENYDPECVLILSADHLYKMDYDKMLKFHKKINADMTVSVIDVPIEESCRFGIMSVDEDTRITKFVEKPQEHIGTLASMGIYIFNWDVLKNILHEDHKDPASENDFGKNIIPRLLSQGKNVYAYTFSGYWKDIGTIDAYYNANMELLEEDPPLDIFEDNMRIFTNSNTLLPHYFGPNCHVENSLISNGSQIYGSVKKSIVGSDVYIGEGSVVEDSVLLPGAVVKENVKVYRSIVGENATINVGSCLGYLKENGSITVIGDCEDFTQTV